MRARRPGEECHRGDAVAEGEEGEAEKKLFADLLEFCLAVEHDERRVLLVLASLPGAHVHFNEDVDE